MKFETSRYSIKKIQPDGEPSYYIITLKDGFWFSYNCAYVACQESYKGLCWCIKNIEREPYADPHPYRFRRFKRCGGKHNA